MNFFRVAFLWFIYHFRPLKSQKHLMGSFLPMIGKSPYVCPLIANHLIPGQRINPGEELVYDDQAYIVYQQANLGSPCLSFDVIPESDGAPDFPLQVYGVAGSQASKANHNNIIVFKVRVWRN